MSHRCNRHDRPNRYLENLFILTQYMLFFVRHYWTSQKLLLNFEVIKENMKRDRFRNSNKVY